MSNSVTMEKIVALAKNRGYIYPGSDIYGGLANTWDYGPLGVEFKNNVKKAWWKKFVQQSVYNVGLDAAILMNPRTWEASGHVGGFSDPLIDCRECKARFRADKLIEEYQHANGLTVENVDGWPNDKLERYIAEHRILPRVRKEQFYGHKAVQSHVQDVSGRDRGYAVSALSATGNGTGHIRKLQKCTAYGAQKDSVRYSADRQIIQERDNAGKFYFQNERVRADGA